MLKKILKTISFFFIIFLISCDKEVGMNGIVVDRTTGERISGVDIKMTSEQGNREDVSKENGYFETLKSFSCGIGNCNNDYKIEFSKSGYQNKVISESYYGSSEAEFVDADKKDTIIVKLDEI
jgi:hypothetical protein